MNRIILPVLFLFSVTLTQAQEVSALFKAGLNFSTINGPSETFQEMDLEDNTYTTGFQIGAGAKVDITDVFGLRAEILYSQKGTDYTYDGQSFWIFFDGNENQIFANGNRRTVLSVTNSYIDVPLLAYVRFGRVELSGGINFGILIGSRGSGEIIFSGTSAGGTNIDPFTIILDYNYLSDAFQIGEIGEARVIQVDGEAVQIPNTVGSRYATLGRDERLFNTLDLGLNGGLAFYLNQGLYLGFRVNYGLVDVTEASEDFSKLSLDDDNNFIEKDDFDRNISLQTSIGFSF